MQNDRRGRGGLVRGAFVTILLIFATVACTPVVGGAALLGLVAIGALTSRCYDYLDVTVFDPEGRKTCAATVTATKGSSQLELSSCYYTPLTDGRWTLRASLPGVPDTLSTLVVDHSQDCTRNVQTVELTLKRAGTPLTPSAAPPVAAPQPTPVPALPTASARPAPEPPAPSSNAPPSSAPPSSALPTSSATPPVGVFPDDQETKH